MPHGHDLHRIPESEHLAFYGALFAMAASDGRMDEEEISLIYATLETDDFSDEGRLQLNSYLIDPPDLSSSLERLADAHPALRYGLFLHLLDLSILDHQQSAEEVALIASAREALGISRAQLKAMERFVKQVQRVAERGVDDAAARSALVSAEADLKENDVPLVAIYFSGTVLELRAAGIVGGLSALAGGLHSGDGASAALLLGVGVYYGLRLLVSPGKRLKRERLKAEDQRHNLVVLENMMEARAALADRIASLPGGTAQAARLTARLEVLERAISRHQEALAGD